MALRYTMVRIDGVTITDRESFHSVFAEAFGFLDGYGRNMDAWIDCMTYLDDPGAEMTTVHVEPGETLTILIENSKDMRHRCPDLFNDLVECTAFVNYRCALKEKSSLLALAFYA